MCIKKSSIKGVFVDWDVHVKVVGEGVKVEVKGVLLLLMMGLVGVLGMDEIRRKSMNNPGEPTIVLFINHIFENRGGKRFEVRLDFSCLFSNSFLEVLGEDGRGKGNSLGGKRDRGGRKNISSYPMNFVIVVVVLEMNSDFSSIGSPFTD